MGMIGRIIAFVITAGVLTQGCGGALISNKEERALGAGVHKEIAAEYQLVDKNDPVSKWARSFIVPFETASNKFRRVKEVGGYKIAVIADDSLINAFAAPGGYTYLTTGLILNARSCAEIAGVVGHELAHITERHGVKAMEQAIAAQGLIEILLEDGSAAETAAFAFGFLQSTRFSRADEMEADEIGLRITYGAGYDPNGMADFFQTLLAGEGGVSMPEFLSSHPATSRRIRSVRQQIKRRYGERAKSKSTRCRTKMKLSSLKARIRGGELKLAKKPAQVSKASKAGWSRGKKAAEVQRKSAKSGWNARGKR